MLKELEAVVLLLINNQIYNVNNVVNKLPESEDKNYFDIHTQMIQKAPLNDDRFMIIIDI